jgi:SAM-dependent methyltransferase
MSFDAGSGSAGTGFSSGIEYDMAFRSLRVLSGLVRLVRSVPYFSSYKRLQERFAFDPWHVKSPFPRRPYKARVVTLVNSFAPQTVVEIGCGLGEILSRIEAQHRFGFDLEAAVIAAADHQHGARATFRAGDLRRPEEIAGIVNRPIDVLVAVNWPHIYPFEEFESAVAELGALVPVSILVMDTIHPERSGYEHYHSVRDIEAMGAIIATVPGGDGIRDLHAIQLPVKASPKTE